jgi:alpha-tubulin suppressor-like RCC1 family protein
MSFLQQPAPGFDPGHEPAVPPHVLASGGATQETPAGLTRPPAAVTTGKKPRSPLGAGLLPRLLLPHGVAEIAAEDSHGFLITTDRCLWAIGENYNGQLGIGGSFNSLYWNPRVADVPVQVAADVARLATGGIHSLFVKLDGTLWAMGDNYNGQLGNGSTLESIPILDPIRIAADVVQAAAGDSHSLFLKTDGSLWAMGSNFFGELGDGTPKTRRPRPVQIATAVTQVAASGRNSYFIREDGTLWGMGGNAASSLGDGTATARRTPVRIAGAVCRVTAGGACAFFIRTDHSLWAVGDNSHGQLGDGTILGRNIPIQVASDVVEIASAPGGINKPAHSLFIKSDGTLWAMGDNSFGQLGDGTSTNRLSPVQVASDVCRIAAGSNFSLFVKHDGSLWAMGAYESYMPAAAFALMSGSASK